MRLTKLTLGAITCLLVYYFTPAHAQVVLNVNSWVPPTHLLTADITMPFCKDVEDATQGRVKCNLLPKAVVAPPQTYDAVRDGLADIGFSANGYTPGRFVGTDVGEFPFLGNTSESISVAFWRIYDRHLKKLDEYKGLHVIGVFTHGPGQIFNTKRPVNSLKDLEGLKIRVGGSLVNDIARAIGTVPMLKPAPESYELLSQGVADGVFFPKEAAFSFKLVPLIKHATFIPGGLYNVTFGLVMNEAKWKQISDADKAAIEKLSGEALARRAGKAWDKHDQIGEKAMRDAGIPIVNASPQFVAELKGKLAPIEGAWAEKAKAKGLDGAATLADLRAEIAKTSH